MIGVSDEFSPQFTLWLNTSILAENACIGDSGRTVIYAATRSSEAALGTAAFGGAPVLPKKT
jgi:hypothetical protein